MLSVIRTIFSPFLRLYQWLGDLLVSDLELRLRQPPAMPPLVFREATLADSERCMELYLANEPGRFPSDARALYAEALLQPGDGRFVVELEGRIVATCKLKSWMSLYQGMCSYGLIDPAYHRRGIGTAMLLFRLVLLARQAPGYNQQITMVPVDASVAFYRRFGFQGKTITRNTEGIGEHQVQLILTPQMAHRCETVLTEAGIEVPPFEIPLYAYEDDEGVNQTTEDEFQSN